MSLTLDFIYVYFHGIKKPGSYEGPGCIIRIMTVLI